jgi:hypothetical protein
MRLTFASMKLVLLLLFLVLGCDSSSEPRTGFALVVVSGANQTSGTGMTLTEPVVVRVADGNDRPVVNAEVQWQAIEGGGTVSERITRTNTEGLATVRWTLGNDPGQQLLLASTDGGSVTIPATSVFRIISVAAGFRHTCALSSSGEAFCWGSNAQFQLGDTTDRPRANPVRVQTLVRFKQLSAGWSHTCGLSRSGDAFCWGENRAAQLGIESTAAFSGKPTQVVGGDTFTDISTGYQHTCGITQAGSARCWGSNAQGQLSSVAPTQLQDIAAGEFHTCAVRTDTTLLCWGWNTTGELGTGAPLGAVVPAPAATAGSPRFTAVATGVRHTCAIATDRRVYCWGRNATGETGQDPFNHQPLPALVAGAENFTAIGTGNVHTCGLSEQRAYCWGAILGNGTSGSSKTPVLVSSTLQFSALSVGYEHTCGVASGEVWCWDAQSLRPVRIVFP